MTVHVCREFSKNLAAVVYDLGTCVREEHKGAGRRSLGQRRQEDKIRKHMSQVHRKTGTHGEGKHGPGIRWKLGTQGEGTHTKWGNTWARYTVRQEHKMRKHMSQAHKKTGTQYGGTRESGTQEHRNKMWGKRRHMNQKRWKIEHKVREYMKQVRWKIRTEDEETHVTGTWHGWSEHKVRERLRQVQMKIGTQGTVKNGLQRAGTQGQKFNR
jgi:hypothetical protein